MSTPMISMLVPPDAERARGAPAAVPACPPYLPPSATR
jgi:hypothetical protein